ncbi:MAG: sigma-70 family RNA polymerase sigma factor [Ardenticatenaceae bacterium]|nr:sigma-70 family RNA polymerase sigma factor [Ardenticatenaceae bacterium]
MKLGKENEKTLKDALAGDITAFQMLFAPFQHQLKSYLYRLTTSRSDADDLTHDTFIRAFDKLSQYRGDSSLKTWVFQIATSLAYNQMQRQKRWTPDVSERAKELVINNPDIRAAVETTRRSSVETQYEIRHHIDTCFTCIGKNLPVENQIALILRDIYDFSIKEVGQIIGKSQGVVKYLLQQGRSTMTKIFDQRCALINKNGICHQCSELNSWFNPRQDQQAALMQLDLVKGSKKYDREALYRLRTELVKGIDPLRSEGSMLQEVLLNCNRLAMGEIQANKLTDGNG